MDVFFFISAFLGSYLLLVKTYGSRKSINIPLLYFHRYYRLIFSIVLLTLFLMYIYPLLGYGPMWGMFFEKNML